MSVIRYNISTTIERHMGKIILFFILALFFMSSSSCTSKDNVFPSKKIFSIDIGEKKENLNSNKLKANNSSGKQLEYLFEGFRCDKNGVVFYTEGYLKYFSYNNVILFEYNFLKKDETLYEVKLKNDIVEFIYRDFQGYIRFKTNNNTENIVIYNSIDLKNDNLLVYDTKIYDKYIAIQLRDFGENTEYIILKDKNNFDIINKYKIDLNSLEISLFNNKKGVYEKNKYDCSFFDIDRNLPFFHLKSKGTLVFLNLEDINLIKTKIEIDGNFLLSEKKIFRIKENKIYKYNKSHKLENIYQINGLVEQYYMMNNTVYIDKDNIWFVNTKEGKLYLFIGKT